MSSSRMRTIPPARVAAQSVILSEAKDLLFDRCGRQILVCAMVALPALAFAQGNLTVERIFSGEFRGAGVGPSRWLDDSTYTVVEPSGGGAGGDLVRVDAASGRKSIL